MKLLVCWSAFPFGGTQTRELFQQKRSGPQRWVCHFGGVDLSAEVVVQPLAKWQVSPSVRKNKIWVRW